MQVASEAEIYQLFWTRLSGRIRKFAIIQNLHSLSANLLQSPHFFDD